MMQCNNYRSTAICNFDYLLGPLSVTVMGSFPFKALESVSAILMNSLGVRNCICNFHIFKDKTFVCSDFDGDGTQIAWNIHASSRIVHWGHLHFVGLGQSQRTAYCNADHGFHRNEQCTADKANVWSVMHYQIISKRCRMERRHNRIGLWFSFIRTPCPKSLYLSFSGNFSCNGPGLVA